MRDSDATILFSIARRLEGGSRDTATIAGELLRPCLHLAREVSTNASQAASELSDFVADSGFRILHLAGPRLSEAPEIGAWVTAVLDLAFPCDT